MFCPMCGAPNEDDAAFCGNCGAALNPEAAATSPVTEEPHAGFETPPPELAPADEWALPPADPVASPEADWVRDAPPPPSIPAAPYVSRAATASVPTNGMAIASLVLGIAGLTIVPLIGSALALIFGYMARREIRQRPGETTGDGIAVGGLVLGWIGVGITVLGLLAVGAVLGCGLCGALGSVNY